MQDTGNHETDIVRMQQVEGDGVSWWVLAIVFVIASCVGVCIGMRAGRKYQPLPTQ